MTTQPALWFKRWVADRAMRGSTRQHRQECAALALAYRHRACSGARAMTTVMRAVFAASAAALLVFGSACGPGGGVLRTPTMPAVAQSPAPFTSPSSPFPAQAVPGRIDVGVDVTDTLTAHGSARFYALTAPADGTLILRLSWKPGDGILDLKLADTRFAAASLDVAPQIVAKVPVIAGVMYPVTIADGAPWDYDDLRLPFVVTTSVEKEGTR
jgi:hypothetical protein